MSADKDSNSEKAWKRIATRIGEQGAGWISAFAAVVALAIGGATYGGISIANNVGHDVPQPTATVTKTMIVPSQKSSTPPSIGRELWSSKIYLSNGYSVPLGSAQPTQSEFTNTSGAGASGDDLTNNNQALVPGSSDQIATLSSGTSVTYQTCSKDEAFTPWIGEANAVTVGTTFCLIEPNRIIGGTVMGTPTNTLDVVLQLVSWQKST